MCIHLYLASLPHTISHLQRAYFKYPLQILACIVLPGVQVDSHQSIGESLGTLHDMTVYIGIGFYTSAEFLRNLAESLGYQKYSVLIKKPEITEYLKSKFNISSLYIATNFDEDPRVVIFEKIIGIADPYTSLTLPIDITTSKEFEDLRRFAEPEHNTELIVYCANGPIDSF